MNTKNTRRNNERSIRFQQGQARIRLDQDIVDRFLEMAERCGGTTGYQTLINAALREYLEGKAPKFEDTLRRIIREELESSAA